MFGLRSRYPNFQRFEEIRSFNEVAHVDVNGIFTCRDPHLATWAQRDGFDVVVDLTGVVSRTPTGYSKAQAAKVLGVLVPTVNKWIKSGKLCGYFFRGELIGFASDDVDALVASRNAEGKITE